MVLATKKNCQRVLAASLRVVSAMTGNPPLSEQLRKLRHILVCIGRATWMATFATNFICCWSEPVNVLSWGCTGAEFWRRIEAYDFSLSTTCYLNACFCIMDTLCNMQHVAFYNWRILAAFYLYLGILYDSSLTTDETFSFGPYMFCPNGPKIWQFQHCMEIGVRNSSVNIIVIGQVKFSVIRASASVSSLVSNLNISRTLRSFLLNLSALA